MSDVQDYSSSISDAAQSRKYETFSYLPTLSEACVEARNMGVELEKEGKDILTKAASHSPELKIAMETWKEIKFEFDTVDKIDVAHK